MFMPKPSAPDCQEFIDVLLRKKKGRRVHFFEHGVDDPIMQKISENLLGLKWTPLETDKKAYWDNIIQFHRAMGYDAFKMIGIDFVNQKIQQERAKLAKEKGSTTWHGLIESMDDFERYPWPNYKDADYESIEYINKSLPEGMGFLISSHMGPFALASNLFFGIENLAFFSVDEPELIRAVFDKLSDIKLRFMEQVIGLPNVLGVWEHDDMGHKTSTMMSPAFLREYALSHHKKMAALAHAHGKIYAMHSCGNMYSLMDELIDDVKIDAKHSFEECILPVTEAKKKYGHRVGLIGGIDIDKLCRLEEKELVVYIRKTLDVCTENGGYALGSGNSIAWYVPVEKYLTLIREGLAYRL
jgi:uroporphyrinogen decarboxylase